METISLEREYDAPISVLWGAITDKEQLRKWYFDFSEDFKLEIGHVFEWTAGPPGGKQWLHRGKILELIDGKKLSHSWEYPGYSGTSVVTWELVAIDEKRTKLLFTHRFVVPFDPSVEALHRKNFVEGWNALVNKALPEFLEKLKAV